MRRNLLRFALTALLVLFAGVARAPAQISSRQVICPPDPIPAGWIKVDVISSPATCGGDAWVIEIFTNKAPGSAMVVCADQPTPGGWRTIGIATSTGQCAGGTVSAGNIKAILRVG
ncbi:MAG TPA: hypothetical protein VGX68_06640 [Thermoanaerobaculia bacterium]|jgi:hypothetical protein|nr:hypothetical protein [Thermoanaerobaculia bacterium]